MKEPSSRENNSFLEDKLNLPKQDIKAVLNPLKQQTPLHRSENV